MVNADHMTKLRFAADSLIRSATAAVMRRYDRVGRAAVRFFDMRMEMLISAWIGTVLCLALVKTVLAPTPAGSLIEALAMALPFVLLAAGPVAGFRLAAGQFPSGRISAQPVVRLARFGNWRSAAPTDIARAVAGGSGGFLVSLLIGIILNVPVRAMEFLASVPAINPADPSWAQAIVFAMTADVVVMTFLYMICFVMALRSVPLFPRMLALVWAVDMGMQIGMAQYLVNAPGLPASVAHPLGDLLIGNMKKVWISVVIWLPYLLVSDQVNLQYRHRIRA